MRNLILSLMIVACGISLAACNSGDSGNAQNMPVGGTFTGTFTPGIGNLTTGGSINTCNKLSAVTEMLTFSVNESGGPTIFQDGALYPNQNIISGTFNNPVNQNNPCLSGTVTYSGCSYANQGKITYTACSVYQSGSSYVFTAIYYLYTSDGRQFIQQGTVNATM
ncbi:MAG TPA: hypothetical protein DHV02_05755 [Neisseriales bacterium]|jgi:hypothetical protein|nr:hypothetical protein [Neisseriales bacterium]